MKDLTSMKQTYKTISCTQNAMRTVARREAILLLLLLGRGLKAENEFYRMKGNNNDNTFSFERPNVEKRKGM